MNVDTYNMKIVCANCDTVNSLKIVKKTSVEQHIGSNKTICRYCECGLEKK